MDHNDILKKLNQVLQERKSASADTSYVADLYSGGEQRIIDKILEEAAELVDAGRANDDAHIIHETADLWFHCLVLLAYKNIDPTAILDELARRFGTSGHQEKKERGE